MTLKQSLRNNIIVVLVVITVFVIGVLFHSRDADRIISDANTAIDDTFSKISFKGKIIDIHIIDRGGRAYAIACVDLDYSNVENFHIFNDISAFRINNNIASLPIGPIGLMLIGQEKSVLECTYVEVNLQNSRKMVFYTNDKITATDDLYYRSSNLREEDFRACDNK